MSTYTFVITNWCVSLRIFLLFDIHGSVHRKWLSRNTNKMQLCNRIYYSKVYWSLNMFRALSSPSGKIFPLSLGKGRSPHGYINQRLQIQFRAPDDELCAFETCWAFNKIWNNKFYHKTASCWYFYWISLVIKCVEK